MKIRSRSPKSNHFFLMFQWCFYASLVRIHLLIQEIECRQDSFLVFIVWWPWKLGQSHQNLINSFNYPNDTIDKIWPESCIWFKRQGAGVTLKMRPRSPKSNDFFPMSQWCFCASLVKITYWFRRWECRHWRLIFTVFIVWWPWKLGQGHENLKNYFSYHNDTIHNVWPESIIWFKKESADKLFWVKMWHSKCWCDLENEVMVTKI